MWHYARGVAHAAKGDSMRRAPRRRASSEINQTADFEMLLAWYVPAPDIAAHRASRPEGRIAQAEGNLDQAIKEFEVAAQIQEGCPTWSRSTGTIRSASRSAPRSLMAGRAEDAVTTFQAALIDAPNNGWALYGLMQAYEAQDDRAAAAETEKLFNKAWAGREPPDLARL